MRDEVAEPVAVFGTRGNERLPRRGVSSPTGAWSSEGYMLLVVLVVSAGTTFAIDLIGTRRYCHVVGLDVAGITVVRVFRSRPSLDARLGR